MMKPSMGAMGFRIDQAEKFIACPSIRDRRGIIGRDRVDEVAIPHERRGLGHDAVTRFCAGFDLDQSAIPNASHHGCPVNEAFASTVMMNVPSASVPIAVIGTAGTSRSEIEISASRNMPLLILSAWSTVTRTRPSLVTVSIAGSTTKSTQ